MEFIYGKQDFKTLERGEENCYLMTNGLGGFSALSMTGSCNRNDHAVLMSCEASEAPNHRCNMIHRLEEILVRGKREVHISSQRFTDGTEEDGYRYQTCFSFEHYPQWSYQAEGVELKKKLLLMPGENTVGISYEIENRSEQEITLRVIPWMEFVPKGEKLTASQAFEITEAFSEIRRCEGAEMHSEIRKCEAWEVQCDADEKQEEETSENKYGPEECSLSGGTIQSAGRSLYCRTDGEFVMIPTKYCDNLYYDYDVCNGRADSGAAAANHELVFRVAPEEKRRCSAVYSTKPFELVGDKAVGQEKQNTVQEGLVEEQEKRSAEQLSRTLEWMEAVIVENRRALLACAGLKDETAEALVLAANQFISYRASTGQKTILAGFPFFEDWGRDTMISLTGCCLSTGQFETAESILRTFMMYCRNGLMPNLFPEGKQEPRYNTVDAALLFILAVYEYYVRTKNRRFVEEAYPVMQDIIEHYMSGTDFCIGMDEDGLIHAGEGFDQVTWMDVRVGDILPTPRHGKPVEINAYWYNALCIMDYFKNMCRNAALSDKRDYEKIAETVRKSFREKFWNKEKNCLKDVISGDEVSRDADSPKVTSEDAVSEYEVSQDADSRKVAFRNCNVTNGAEPLPDNQIRCNQIWAVSLPFSLLDREQEKQVVETVFRKLYTPLGLRTLESADPEFRPLYGGELLQRDLAYHQGTVWAFPLGGYYLAYLKVNDYSEEAKRKVRGQLRATKAALREGCIGQLPEIYDGLEPTSSKGCFAQAWSVGELLRVYEALEK